MKCIEDEIPFEVPEGWEWCRVRDIAAVKGGKRLPKGVGFSPCRTAHAYIRVTDMKNHSINTDDLKYISEEVFLQIKNYTISKDDLYVTIAGTIGVTGEVPTELDGMNLTENAVKITNIQINKNYLCLIIQSEFVQQQFQDKTHQVAMPKLALERILSTLIPVCTITTQSAMVSKFVEMDSLINQIREGKEILAETVSLTKSKILDLAIRGKLVPQNPDDEPASVLLERIRTEKEELIKAGKIKRDKKESIIFRGDDNSYYEFIDGQTELINNEIPFELPDNWEWVRLSSVMSLSSGKAIKVRQLTDDGEFPVYGGNGINGLYSEYNVDSNAIIIGRVGYYCGSVYKTDRKAWVTDNALIATIKEPNIFNIDFLVAILKYLDLGKTSVSTAQPVVSGKGILPLIVPVPPINEQILINSTLQKVNSHVLQIESELL